MFFCPRLEENNKDTYLIFARPFPSCDDSNCDFEQG